MLSRTEKAVMATSAFFLFILLASLLLSGLRLPDCVTTLTAFNKGEVIQKANNLYEVHVVAKMWAFDPPEIKIKPNTTLDIYLASLDVNHGFHIENTNVNLMAVPGAVNYARVTLRDPGIYHIVCHEYCGAGHHNMTARIIVGDELDLPVAPVMLTKGKDLFQSKGCISCHSPEGANGVGPHFKGLFGRQEKLNDGTVITVDEKYVAESIREPSAKIVFGFQPLMPKLQISDDELKELLNYLKNL